MNTQGLKFLDVGCKTGGSFSVAQRYGYDLSQGLGIDTREHHIEEFISKGYKGMIADATNIPFPDNSFELVIFSHVLEHMKNEEDGKKALNECLRVSSNLIFISLPFFDEDEYLNSLGLKTFYSDWTGHTNKVHLKTLTEEWLKGYAYEIWVKKHLKTSMESEIIPISAPKDSHDYDPDLHGEKPNIIFTKDIWREYELLVEK